MLVDELSIEAEAHANYALWKKSVWECRVSLILINNLKFDVVKIVFDNCLE